jgi:hypothetical protein
MDLIYLDEDGPDPKEVKKAHLVNKRLSVSICLLLKENPFLPLNFIYDGNCLLTKLK